MLYLLKVMWTIIQRSRKFPNSTKIKFQFAFCGPLTSLAKKTLLNRASAEMLKYSLSSVPITNYWVSHAFWYLDCKSQAVIHYCSCLIYIELRSGHPKQMTQFSLFIVHPNCSLIRSVLQWHTPEQLEHWNSDLYPHPRQQTLFSSLIWL